MLKRLTIHNYALIENLDIEFEEGLNIITGETGAGKSIILGALSLLLGAKSYLSVLRDPSKNCIVEAEFDISKSDHLIDLIFSNPEEHEDFVEEDFRQPFLLRRVINSSGRSRSFFNDEPVNLPFLSSISSKLIDIHQQHQQLLLFDPTFQLSVLDFYAKNEKLLEEYKGISLIIQQQRSVVEKLDREIGELIREREYNEFTYKQIEEAAISEDELDLLESEQKQLANAEEIKKSLCQVQDYFSEPSIVQRIKDICYSLNKIKNYIDVANQLVDRLDTIKIEIDDIEKEIAVLNSRVEVSPQRLEFVDNRISTIYSLINRNQCSSLKELIDLKERLKYKMEDIDSKREEREGLCSQLVDMGIKREEVAQNLHERRIDIIPRLSQELAEKIRELEMPYAELEISLSQQEQYTETGRDRVRYLFSANGKKDMKEISSVASGGELARIMLSLKAIIAGFTPLPTMIFDEIDTGVSGSIADKMGSLIGDLGRNMQILAITHLPQIASKRGAHFLVYKQYEQGGDATTLIKRMNDQERIKEVARMLSGTKLTEASINNAKEMFENNNK